jgi:hypothetical protein
MSKISNTAILWLNRQEIENVIQLNPYPTGGVGILILAWVYEWKKIEFPKEYYLRISEQPD